MIFLRRLLDLPLMVILMGIGAVAMYLPAAHALALRQHAVARAFFYSGTVLLILVAMIAIATATYRARNQAQSQLASVIGAYLVLPVVMAVPLHQALPGLSFGDAWFEMLSCFTTTGATLFETPGALAPPIHFWRSLVGWLGGFYILVATLAVLAPMGLGGVELFGGRAPSRVGAGVQISRIAEPSLRVIHFSAQLFPAYAGLTLLLWVALLLAGDSALIALSHAMGTLSTSGISPLTGLNGTASGIAGEVMIFVFLGLAVTHRLWPGVGMTDRTLRIWRDPELRLALAILAAVAAALVLRHLVLAAESESLRSTVTWVRAVWGAVFTSLSFLTTTGYQSVSWPDLGPAGMILLGPVIIGGGAATTAGGIKLLRVYALLRHGERELERIVHPHSIGGHGPVARRLRREGAYLAWIFFMVFGLSIAGVTAALTLAGLEFEQALVLGIASLSTTGQLAAVFGDAPISYAELSFSPKAILGAAMVLGRLEILAIFAVLAPKDWAR
jgi:trk system potassium uptake protein